MSPKRAPRDRKNTSTVGLSRTQPADPNMSTLVVLDAGGGSGRQNLTFDTLFEGQCSMYARTLNQQSDFQTAHLEQEKRQLTVVDKPISIYINVSREDFPDVTAKIDIVYIRSASSQAWAQLMKDICVKLKIDFIHSLLDRVDKSPVHRILRLRPGGDYLARQRENSAILEVINTGKTPIDVSWDITMDINDVKQSLAFDQRNMPVIDKRVASLVAKPLTRETQRDIASLIMNAVSPKAAVGVIEQFHKQYIGVTTDENAVTAEDSGVALAWGDITKYGDAIDIVTLHRLCLETLNRFVTQGRAKHVAGSPCFEYVCNVIDGLRSEVDVVTIGLKLLSDVMKYLVEERETVYHVILNCVLAYAPAAAMHRLRNPKRLQPIEDQMTDSYAGNNYAGTTSNNYNPTGTAGMGAYKGSNIGAPVMGEREAIMPDVRPGLARYGDFYGRSKPPEPGEVDKLSENIKKVDDVLTRLQREKITGISNSNEDATNTTETATQETKANAPGAPQEVKALVRGRVRIDHSAASHAIQSAFQAPTVTSAPTSVVTKAPHVRQQETISADSQENEEFLRQQAEFKEKTRAAKRAKYQFKFKVKSGSGGGEGNQSDGGDTGDEKEKKQWKGTVGVIGRRAPEKVIEVKIDFKKKIEFDPTKENVEATEHDAAVVPSEETPVATEVVKSEQELAEEQDRAAIATVLLASAAVKKKRRKHKFAIVPLPLVPCVQFRGLSGKYKQNIAMQQSFATLYKMISQSFGNRDVASKMGVADEISVIVTVCQGMPRVLDYYMWIVDALYRDGFGEINTDELDIALEDYTMVLSVDPSTTAVENAASTTHGDKDKSKDKSSLTGFQFDAISEMSVPSVDVDGLRSEATPYVNMGVPGPPEESPGDRQRRISRRETTTGSDGAAGPSSKVGTEDAINENAPEMSNQIKKAANQMLVNALGLFEFEARYVTRPAESIVLAVAMISSHAELEMREKQMANRWLDVWDDGSRAYKLLKKKGMDLAGL